MKMNLYTLYQKMEKLEKIVIEQKLDFLNNFRAIDWRDYIEVPLEGLTKMWKYKKQYYDKSTRHLLYDKIVIDKGYQKKRPAFYTMLENEDRQGEMWVQEIQLIYASWSGLEKWLTCEGHLLTSKSLSHIRGNPSNNKIRVVNKGEPLVFSRSMATYVSFVDKGVDKSANYLFFDGFFGNCGIDNIALADKNQATKGDW